MYCIYVAVLCKTESINPHQKSIIKNTKHNYSRHWLYVVLVTNHPHAISQKVLRVKQCFNIIQKAHQSKLENDNRNSALLSILFEIWHEDNLSQGQRTTNAF